MIQMSYPGFQRFDAGRFFTRLHGGNFQESQLKRLIRDSDIDISPEGPWICGGAIRKTIQGLSLDSDLDVFFRSDKQYNDTIEKLRKNSALKKIDDQMFRENSGPVTNVFLEVSEFGKPRELKVQLIRMAYYEIIEDVLDSFDFTISQFGYDGMDIVAGPYSMYDLGRKRLALHKVTFPVSNLRRLIKYTNQGFYACNGCLASLANGIWNQDNLNLEIGYVD